MLMADAVARDFARKLVQIERQSQSLLASHGTIFFNLCVKRCLRRHKTILTRVERERTVFCNDTDRLGFAEFAFENIDTQQIENIFFESGSSSKPSRTEGLTDDLLRVRLDHSAVTDDHAIEVPQQHPLNRAFKCLPIANHQTEESAYPDSVAQAHEVADEPARPP